MLDDGADQEARFPPYLRLVWSNPTPPPPRRPINLALAIERQLAGYDGLSETDFLRVYSGR